jgi:hypothetical protein
MADMRIKWNEQMVGYDHATLDDTLNRRTDVEHANDGTHLNSYASLYEYTPTGSDTSITTGGTYVKWAHSIAGEVKGGDFITSSTSTDDITIGTDGAGIYDILASVSIEGQAGMDVSVAVFVDGVREDRLTRSIGLGAAHEHFPDSVDLKIGTLVTGDVTTMQSIDATYYQFSETATPTGFILEVIFNDVEAPLLIDFAGRYSGNAGDEVECQIYDADTGADEVQDGGNGYTCIRSHTSGASTQPGTGADWESYWELKGAASGEAAWVTATGYDDAFDEIRSAIKDLPYSASADYVRRWVVEGTHVVRQKYSDSNTDCRIRFIHNTSGNATHDTYIDSISVQDDHASASITMSDLIDLAAAEVVDVRLTADEDATVLHTTSVNFKVNRVNI